MPLFHVSSVYQAGQFLHFVKHPVWKFLAGPTLLAGPSSPPSPPYQGPNPYLAAQSTRTEKPPPHFPRVTQLDQPAAGQIDRRIPRLYNVLEPTMSC